MRTIVEKYQRLTELRSRYDEQIKSFAEMQLKIMKKVITEFKLNSDYGYRDYMYYDWLEMNSEGDGSVCLWERGRCGDSDSVSTSIYVHDLILKGDIEGYEKYYRARLQKKGDEAVAAQKREVKTRRVHLEKELQRITEELGKKEE